MEQDYINLCTLINSLEVKPGWEWHAELARDNLRQLLIDMLDKGPEHLIGVWRMYMKTHPKYEEYVPWERIH